MLCCIAQPNAPGQLVKKDYHLKSSLSSSENILFSLSCCFLSAMETGIKNQGVQTGRTVNAPCLFEEAEDAVAESV